MKGKFFSIQLRLTLLVGVGVFITVATLVLFSTKNAMENAISSAKDDAVAVSKNYANQVKARMDKAIFSAKAMADALSYVSANHDKAISREQAQMMGARVLLSDPENLGFTICFEPNAFDGKDSRFINTTGHDNTGRFISYLTKSESGGYVIEPLIDYDKQDLAPWYWKPKEYMSDFVTEPIHYPIQGKMVFMVSFMTPIINNSNFLGVTGIDYSIDFLQELVSNSKFYDGKAKIAIVSNEGVYAANSAKADNIGKSIQEDNAYNFQNQLKELKEGKEVVLETNEQLNVYVPI